MIILTSSVASVADHLYKRFLADKGFTSVLFVDTAAEPEIAKGDAWLQADLKSLEDQGYTVDRYTITGKTTDEIAKKIDAYDIFYMCGGNTSHLLDQLQKTSSLDLIKEKVKDGKPYIATSAGSIIAGPRLPDYFNDESSTPASRKCLNFVNFTIAPHWGSEGFKERYLESRLRQVYKDTQEPLLLLTDTQYVFVGESGKIEIIDTKVKDDG